MPPGSASAFSSSPASSSLLPPKPRRIRASSRSSTRRNFSPSKISSRRPPANPAAARLLLALDGVEDPQNLGALLRVADGAGVDGVVLTERRSAPLSPAAVKASAGAAEHLRIARVVNLVRALEELKRQNLWIVGLDERGDSRLRPIRSHRQSRPRAGPRRRGPPRSRPPHLRPPAAHSHGRRRQLAQCLRRRSRRAL